MTRYLLLLALAAGAMMEQQDSSPPIPIKTKDSQEGVSAFEAKWYGGILKRLDEENLNGRGRDEGTEVYRVMLLPTWGNPIMVRVEKKQDGFLLVSKRADGQAGYDPGKVVESKEVQLSAEDARELRQLISDTKFFEMPTKDGILGLDGDETVFEGVSNGKYHVITRWCATSHEPKKRGLAAFNALCKFLIDKSGLSERPQNKRHRLM